MKLNLKYFGLIAELMNTSELDLEVSSGISVGELKSNLINGNQELERISFSVAVNQQMVADDSFTCNENDEVALFPPFAGG